MAEMAMWALESGVRRIALRGDHQLDFWIGNILDQNFFLSVLKLKRSDLFLSTTFTAQRRVKAAIGSMWAMVVSASRSWAEAISSILPFSTTFWISPVCTALFMAWAPEASLFVGNTMSSGGKIATLHHACTCCEEAGR